jgi:molybdopterin converting factor small subunit
VLVRFFGTAKALAGADSIELAVEGGTLAQLIERLGEQCGPEMKALLPFCRFANGSEVLDLSSAVPRAGELVVLPPVSGG